jgi:MFS transporter, DHA1 family, tetracycline resistance protein
MDTSPTTSQAPDTKALIFIIMTAFLTSMGFGIITPVAPFLVTRYVSDPNSVGIVLGWLSSVYALCQFIFAPGLGILSDRYGRRPILLLCMAGSAVGYLFLGIGGSLWILFLGRIIDGITGGNFGVTFAYIADITPVEQRGRYFGMLGAISGIGFILGPALGGLVAKLGYEAPFYLAAVFTFANVIYGLIFMPESLSKENRTHKTALSDLNPLSALKGVMAIPQLRWLLIVSFLYTLPFAALGANLGLFAKDSLGWDADSIGVIFALVGVTDIVVQGVLLQWLLKRFRDNQVAVLGFICEGIGYVLIASIAVLHTPVPLLIGTIFFAMGDGLLGPSLGGLLSRAAGEQSQGQVQGGSQSVHSLAQIAGPSLGGAIYDGFGHATIYVAGAGIVAVAVAALSRVFPSPAPQQEPKLAEDVA